VITIYEETLSCDQDAIQLFSLPVCLWMVSSRIDQPSANVLAKSSHLISCEPSVPVTQNARRHLNPREDMFPQHLTEIFSVHVLVRHNDNPFTEPTNHVQHRIVLFLVFWETTKPVQCNTLKRPAGYMQWVQCNRKGSCRLVMLTIRTTSHMFCNGIPRLRSMMKL
jgi:hypothetical protein